MSVKDFARELNKQQWIADKIRLAKRQIHYVFIIDRVPVLGEMDNFVEVFFTLAEKIRRN